jgi:signal transduction histidine kinase/FixJ family two-component response regulator
MRTSPVDPSQHPSLPTTSLLIEDEVVVVVDDDRMIREPLKTYLEKQGLAVLEASSAAELHSLLGTARVALIVLDIGLPDQDGLNLLPELMHRSPDLGAVMLTGVDDMNVALECMRKGADDFLTKPVQFHEIFITVRQVLEKRRLILENRKYHTDLENAHFRIQLLHQLSLKMNTAYLSTTELDDILQAILVGITAEEGLGFNRAFLAIFDEKNEALQGRMAIGASCREEAGAIWAEMSARHLGFLDIVHSLKDSCYTGDANVNRIVKSIRVPVTDSDHILIKAARERRSINVVSGKADDVHVAQDLINLLGEDTFIVLPLFSPGRSLGVIIADNFVTRAPISRNLISTLELFASQASLAIEHSHLYMNMQKKIVELEDLNNELEKNKDLLVEAERYSALGQMAAQLVHAIRNPITTIGGAARMLSKKVTDEEWLKFIRMMVKETARVESTLEDLFDFVKHVDFTKERAQLYPLIKKTVMLIQPTMLKQNIVWHLNLPEPEPEFEMDVRQIRQMLLHLVKNAVEAMPEGGDLTIAYTEENGWGQIFIADTGTGMGEENVERAHDPFFTTKTYGTGLGLTMVERIVEAHDGSFLLRTRETGGMEATVRLPLQSATNRADRDQSAVDVEAPSFNYTPSGNPP